MRVVLRLFVLVAWLGTSGLYAARNSHSGSKTDTTLDAPSDSVSGSEIAPEILDKRLQEAKEIARVTGVPFNEKFVADSLNFWEQRGLMVPDPEVSDRDIADYFTDVLHLPATSNNIELGREYIDVKEGKSDAKAFDSDGAKDALDGKGEKRERREENREAKEIRREIGREIGNENFATGKNPNPNLGGNVGGNDTPSLPAPLNTGAVSSAANTRLNSPAKLSGLSPSPLLPPIPTVNSGPGAFASPKATELSEGFKGSNNLEAVAKSTPPAGKEAKGFTGKTGTAVNLSFPNSAPAVPTSVSSLVPAAVGSSETGISGNFGELVRETFGIETMASDKNSFFNTPVETPAKYAIPSPVNAYLNVTVSGGTSESSATEEGSGSASAGKTGTNSSASKVGGILDRFMSGWNGRRNERGLSSRPQLAASSDSLANDYEPTPVNLTERQTKLRRFFNWTLISLLSGITASGIYGFRNRRKES